MATSTLNAQQLTFTTNGSTIASRISATADTFTLGGAGGTNSVKITNLTTPTASLDAANKSYVDSLVTGLKWLSPVRVATTGSIVIATDLNVGDVIDTITLIAGDRVLVKDQGDIENGIYVAGSSPVRSDDMAAGYETASNAMFVQEGSTNADIAFVCTNDKDNDVVDTDTLIFVQFSNSVTNPGGSDTQIQFNNNGVFGGLSSFTTPNDTDLALSTANMLFDTDSSLIFGATGAGTSIVYNGTSTVVTSEAGNLIIDNTNTSGSTINKLGTDTNTTDFQVQNDTGTSLLTVDGSGQVDILNNLDVSGGIDIDADNQALTIGASADFTITHTNPDTVIDNTNATGATVFRLGADDSEVTMEIQNNSEELVAKFYGDKLATFYGDVTIHGDAVGTATVTTITDANNVTYTADQLHGNLIRRDCNGAARTDTLPTATEILAEIHDAIVGSFYRFSINNFSDADEDLTLAVGTGVTFVGPITVEQNEIRTYQVVINDIGTPTVTIYSLASNGEGTGTTPGAPLNSIQFNNSGTFGGIDTFTSDDTDLELDGGNMTFTQDSSVIFGATGAGLGVVYNGTDNVLTSTADNLLIDNTNTTGSTSLKLGTTTNATKVEVVDSADSSVASFYGDSTSTLFGDVTVQGKTVSAISVASVVTAGAETYTAAQMKGGLISRDPAGADRIDTTDTAANIVASIHDAIVGSSYEFTVINVSDALESITVQSGVGVTMDDVDILQNESRTFLLVVSNIGGGTEAVVIYPTSSDGTSVGGANTQLQFNNNGALGGISTLTTDGADITLSGANQIYDADASVIFGATGAGLGIAFDGTNNVLTSTATGDVIVDNTVAGSNTIFRLGDDSTAALQIKNNSDAIVASIDAVGQLTVENNINISNDNTYLNVGSDGFRMFNNGTVGTIEGSLTAGDDILIDGNNSTSSVIIRTGSDDAGSIFVVQNDSATPIFSIDGAGAISANSNVIGSVADPVLDQDAATKAYVDSQIGTVQPGTPAQSIQFNNGDDTFGGIPGITSTGAGINFADDIPLVFGDLNEFDISYESSVNVMKFSSANSTGAYVFKLGADNSDATLEVHNSSESQVFRVEGSGDVYGTTFNTTSDATFKTNIHALNNPLTTLNRVNGYSYNWVDNANESEQWGVLAQQLEEAGLDHLVSHNGRSKAVNYLGLIPLMIEAIKELSQKDVKKLEYNNSVQFFHF